MPAQPAVPLGIDFEALFDASPNPYVLLAPDHKIVWANEAYLRVTGRDRADIVGRDMFDAFPGNPGDPDDASVRQLRASLNRTVTERTVDTLALIRYAIPRRTPEGVVFEERFWSATHTPMLDARGEVKFILQHTVDVTEFQRLKQVAKSAERALEQHDPTELVEAGIFRRAQAVQEKNWLLDTERRHLRRLFEQAPGFVAFLRGPQHVFELANDAYYQVVGHRDLTGKSVRAALPEVREQGFIDLLDKVYETGVPFVGREIRVVMQRKPDGPLDEVYLDFVYQPIIDADGSVTGIFVQGNDITERRRAEEALRASHERTFEILESISDAFYAVDREWRLTYVNRKAEQLWRRKREELVGKVIWEEFPQTAGTEAQEAHFLAAKERRAVHLDLLSPILHHWIEVSIYPHRDGLSIYFRDITERKRAEQRQNLLLDELSHRVKNTLLAVQSIAAQTLRSAPSSEAFREAFSTRLRALAHRHNLLSQTSWEGALLRDVVAAELEPYLGGDERRMSLSGRAVVLEPRTVLALGMAFHELATNAAKYGALTTADGRIEISWDIRTSDDGGLLCLRWVETGGPPVGTPDRRGFGSALIERSLAHELDGKATLDFNPDGVRCVMEIPLTSNVSTGDRASDAGAQPGR
ncbi:MAG TPA: PAS domain-containing protein [Alphaproteobacteria bacterium]|nr:PAS domain-containing protein [Alphaproteobacteria bacterium]